MNTISTIFTYTISWFLVLGMAFLVIGHYLQYRGLEHKSTKALKGLITITLLWLATTIGLVIAQTHFVDFATRRMLPLLVFEGGLIQCINQWTVAPMQTPKQRDLRWMYTSLVLAVGLVLVGFLVFFRS